MPTRPTFVLLLVLSIGTASAFAETSFDINARLVNYDLVKATGTSSINGYTLSSTTDLPPVTVKSGSEKLIQLTKEFRYPKEFNAKGRATLIRIAYRGIRLPIYVRETEEGKLTFLLRAEICELDDAGAVSKTTSSVQGIAYVGKMRTIEIGAPGGNKATLQITFTVHSSVFPFSF